VKELIVTLRSHGVETIVTAGCHTAVKNMLDTNV